MPRRPEIRNLAPAVAAGDEAKSDHAQQQINLKNKRPCRENQPPKAISKKFGFAFAVYVRDLGVISRVGLYGDAVAARAAAADLNAIFAEGSST